MKTACVIYYSDKRYNTLARCACDSFKKWHPNVPLYEINYTNVDKYKASKSNIFKTRPGIAKVMLAIEIMSKYAYDKMIMLGADTITCSRLDEFLDRDEDLLVTLDYPYQIYNKRRDFYTPVIIRDKKSKKIVFFFGPAKKVNRDKFKFVDHAHLNADVLCVNNIEALKAILKISLTYKDYGEQAGLNDVVWGSCLNKFTVEIVDGPYPNCDVIYNARAKGNITAESGIKPWGPFTQSYYIKDDKLFTYDHKQIKVFHYSEGFGLYSIPRLEYLMDWWINIFFNDETKQFFKEHCACDKFFETKFRIE